MVNYLQEKTDLFMPQKQDANLGLSHKDCQFENRVSAVFACNGRKIVYRYDKWIPYGTFYNMGYYQ